MPTPTPFQMDYEKILIQPMLQSFPLVLNLYSQIIIKNWWLFVLLLVMMITIIAIKIYNYQRIRKAGISEVDKMSGVDFEVFLTSLFTKLGYSVKQVGRTGDLGSDLIIEMNDLKIAVQAKRYKNKVGPDAIREVNTVIKPRNCDLGMVVTNSNYTNEAMYLAKKNNITLWDRNDLINNILKTKTS